MTPQVTLDLLTATLSGPPVQETRRTIADMAGYYLDEAARRALDPQTQVYRVQAYYAVPEGEEGGLFLGNTFVEPGMVGDEYFMTKGHSHLKLNRSEYYITVAGTGALILMDDHRRTVYEAMIPGSVHYIPFRTAHRVANTGSSVLRLLACWPSDAGHAYEAVAERGFSARLRRVGGAARLVEEA